MINLIGNELKKILKKKSLYITLFITLAFIIMFNVIYKMQGNDNGYDATQNIEIYKEQLASLNVNNEETKNVYNHYKTEIQLAELVQKYGDYSTWQARIIEEQVRTILGDMNYYQFVEKNETEFKNAEQKCNDIVSKLDAGDWSYFAKLELKDVEDNLKTQKNLEKITENKKELESIQYQIYNYEVQKQVLDWRLEKDISYGYNYKNDCLNYYMSSMMFIKNYEASNEKHSYSEKQEYYQNIERAAISKYEIENDTNLGDNSNAKGILIESFNQFEIFIMIMIMMIAGTIVSEEFNKGTVKLLLIKPYKRSTILASKFITCLIMLVVIILLVIGMQFVVGGITQGFNSFASPTIVYNHLTNQVEEVNLVSYLAMQAVGKLPIYILLMTLAFAFSTIFTNSALAITIGLLGYMGAPFVNQLGTYFKLDWLKFFVTPNWDLTQYLFGGLPSFEGLTPLFSIAIIAIYMVIMLVPTFIILKKKNIKNI